MQLLDNNDLVVTGLLVLA